MAIVNALSHRQRATLAAVAALGALPFTLTLARTTFEPYFSMGRVASGLSWIGLLSIYYVTARNLMDLCRDALDYFAGQYQKRGGDFGAIDKRRKKPAPYDLLTDPRLRREFSKWQYMMAIWTFFEILLGWIAFGAMLYAFDEAPLLKGTHHTFGQFVAKMSFLLVGFALYSMAYRFNIGLAPLAQRCLGAPDALPGQNVFPAWLNELAIRLSGRPM